MDSNIADINKALTLLTTSIGPSYSKEKNNYESYVKKCDDNSIPHIKEDFFKKISYDYSKK